ncbi:30774_t:CDS:2, partial [Gigaspora margarita]
MVVLIEAAGFNKESRFSRQNEEYDENKLMQLHCELEKLTKENPISHNASQLLENNKFELDANSLITIDEGINFHYKNYKSVYECFEKNP